MKVKSRFTLIELVCVLCIIVILFCLLVTVLGKVKKEVEDVVCKDNCSEVLTAFLAYSGDNNGKFPLGESWQDGGSFNYFNHMNIKKGYQKYGFFALAQPVRELDPDDNTKYLISRFNGYINDLSVFDCHANSNLEFGTDYSNEWFPAKSLDVNYEYRGTSNPPQDEKYWRANYGGPDRVTSDIQAMIADVFVKRDAPHTLNNSYYVGYSDGTVLNVPDDTGYYWEKGDGFKRHEIWRAFDKER